MLLSVKNLHVSYGHIKALQGISFDVDEGEIICIIGANGAGKSTTLRAISRLVPVLEGDVIFEGKSLLHVPPEKVVSELGISHVPEGRRIFGNLTVMENLKLATYARKDKENIKRDMDYMFTVFPRLQERINQKAGTLSGGEQQMLAVARGIMAEPIVLMMDELSLGLAPVLVLDLLESLNALKETGITMLLVEQNVQMALAISDYGFVFSHGKTEIEGTARELLDNEHIQAAYLGM